MYHSHLSRITTTLFLLAATFLTYLPSLFYPFNFDDVANITRNFSIRTFDVWHKMLTYRRWFGEWLNALVFQIDGFNPTYYRLCNVGIHLLSGALVLMLVYRLLRRLPQTSMSYLYRWPIATLTSALFLLHPVQTQTISYVIQGKLEGCATLLILSSFLLLLTAIESQSTVRRTLSITSALVCSIIACGSKEITIMAPLLFLLTDWFFIAQQELSNLKKRWWLHVLYGGAVYLVMVYYFGINYILKVFTLGHVAPNNCGNVLTAHATQAIAPLPFLISQPKVLLHYLWMFLWPWSISVEYDWVLTPSLFSLEFVLPTVLLASLCWLFLRPRIQKKTPLLSFGLLWFFITMAPRASIIPSSELVVDYKTYLASIGWLLILAYGIVAIVHWMSTQDRNVSWQLYYPALCSFTFLLSMGTYHRNQVWSSGRAFWKDVITHAPGKARGYNNYGVEIVKEANALYADPATKTEALAIYKEAIASYEKALSLDEYYAEPYSNLSVIYAALDQHDKAAKVVERAIKMFPDYPEAHNNLGSIYISLRKYNEAEEVLKKAIALRPYYGKAYFNLARLNLDLHREEEALALLKKASEGDFDTNPECFYALGQLSMRMGKHTDAIAAFEKLSTLHAGSGTEEETATSFNLANALHLAREHDRAHDLYLQLAQRHPERNQYWHNLAENLFQKGDIAAAENYFARATQEGQSLLQSHFRLAECKERNGNPAGAVEILNTVMQADVNKQLPERLRQRCYADIRRLRTGMLVG